MVEKHKTKLQAIEDQRLDDLQKLANQLLEQSVTIEANANEDGHLYGSVGAKEIAAALKQNDISLSPDQIRLDGPLRELALYTVKIRLHDDIETDLKVWVVQGSSEEEAATSS
jgi:large subunit ribosomal protein L9